MKNLQVSMIMLGALMLSTMASGALYETIGQELFARKIADGALPADLMSQNLPSGDSMSKLAGYPNTRPLARALATAWPQHTDPKWRASYNSALDNLYHNYLPAVMGHYAPEGYDVVALLKEMIRIMAGPANRKDLGLAQ